MNKKFYKNEKFQKAFYGVLYFLLVCGVVVCGCLAFEKFYYEHIYVTGTSMMPTLEGGSGISKRNHYGKADKSSRTLDNLRRFDVVITYFPDTWSVEHDVYKIKRVWGFPGETIHLFSPEENVLYYTITKPGSNYIETYEAKIEVDPDYVVYGQPWKLAKFTTDRKSFRVHADSLRTFNYTLKDDEYFLMGDNWSSSSDSYYNRDKTGYVTKSLLQGKVVQIQGTAIVDEHGNLSDKRKIQGMFEF